MKLTAFQWALACATLNAVALLVVALLAGFSDLSFGTSVSIGSIFVIVSAIPFAKIRSAFVSGG